MADCCPKSKELFEKYDANKDGHLTIDEFKALCQEWCSTSCPNECEATFKKFDKDSDGKLDFNEFTALMKEKKASQ